ncbi:hypothetical protein LIER_17545 [Lithospermum erythrorhizon]|uniref:Auxin-responsive protein n=1 Tax=Lithospermum erythrorhizon TaxID=34254 RepID=A0AAV3QBS3_LITER
MMSKPLEHDYIGLAEQSRNSVKLSSSSCVGEKNEKANVVNLKETELRLGLPGSESLHRNAKHGLSLFDENKNNYLSNLNIASGGKRGFSDTIYGSNKWVLSTESNVKLVPVSHQAKPLEGKPSPNYHVNAPASKAQVVGWPPVRSFRKNTLAANLSKINDVEGEAPKSFCLYVKVSMDGAPYLRKVDLKHYSNYTELSSALEKMFSCFTIGQCTSPNIPGQGGLSESRLMDLLHGSEYVLTYEDKDSDWMLVGDVPWEMFLDSCKRLRIVKSTDAIGLAPRALKSKNQN